MRRLLISVFGQDLDHKPYWGFAKIPQPDKEKDTPMDLGDTSYEYILQCLAEERYIFLHIFIYFYYFLCESKICVQKDSDVEHAGFDRANEKKCNVLETRETMMKIVRVKIEGVKRKRHL